MANMTDYLFWRGDLTFENVPFNEIDALILCQITYLHFDGLVSPDFCDEGISLKELKAKFLSSDDFEKRKNAGAMINKQSADLFERAAESKRFGNLKASAFINKIDSEKEEQFAAITYASATFSCIVFRGTDDTIVGWKEDFNLGYLETVPAQSDALNYLKNIAKNKKLPIKIAGHSKGGNLAIYSAAMASKEIQEQIQAIYNNDGPGFSKNFFQTGGYKAIQRKIHSYFPRLSIIGMIFEHDATYTTVESDQKGLYQHDPFSWHTLPLGFVEEEDTSKESKIIATTVNNWINELEIEQRELFIETIFTVLKDSKATTNTELTQNIFTSVKNMIKSFVHLDSKTKNAVSKTIQLLLKEAGRNIRGKQ